jgi:hypothetical protein
MPARRDKFGSGVLLGDKAFVKIWSDTDFIARGPMPRRSSQKAREAKLPACDLKDTGLFGL